MSTNRAIQLDLSGLLAVLTLASFSQDGFAFRRLDFRTLTFQPTIVNFSEHEVVIVKVNWFNLSKPTSLGPSEAGYNPEQTYVVRKVIPFRHTTVKPSGYFYVSDSRMVMEFSLGPVSRTIHRVGFGSQDFDRRVGIQILSPDKVVVN